MRTLGPKPCPWEGLGQLHGEQKLLHSVPGILDVRPHFLYRALGVACFDRCEDGVVVIVRVVLEPAEHGAHGKKHRGSGVFDGSQKEWIARGPGDPKVKRGVGRLEASDVRDGASRFLGRGDGAHFVKRLAQLDQVALGTPGGREAR